MGSKRRNVNNQVSKEDYEAQQLREERMGGGSNQARTGFARASNEVMMSRRIARVSNRNRSQRSVGSSDGVTAPSKLAPIGIGPPSNDGSGSKNPFANTLLTTTAGSSKNDDTTKPNPFASISFASSVTSRDTTNAVVDTNSNPTKRTKVSTFTASSKQSFNEMASNPISTFDFGTKIFSNQSSSATNSFSTTNVSAMTNQNGTNHKQNDKVPLSEGTLLNLTMLRMAQLEAKANPLSDWTEWMKKYVEQSKDCEDKEQKDAAEKKNGDGDIPTKSSKSFSFATASKPINYSSASTSASAPTSAPSTGAVISNEDDPEKIAKVVNEDDEELYECKARYRKFIESENKWKSFAAGNMRLTRSKTTQKTQMVIRNDGGKVQFNVRVAKGMKLHSSQNKDKGNILFGAIQDEKTGPEKFCVTVKLGDFDGLLQQLKLVTE